MFDVLRNHHRRMLVEYTNLLMRYTLYKCLYNMLIIYAAILIWQHANHLTNLFLRITEYKGGSRAVSKRKLVENGFARILVW